MTTKHTSDSRAERGCTLKPIEPIDFLLETSFFQTNFLQEEWVLLKFHLVLREQILQ